MNRVLNVAMARNFTPSAMAGIPPLMAVCGRRVIFSSLEEISQFGDLGAGRNQMGKTPDVSMWNIRNVFNVAPHLIMIAAQRLVSLSNIKQIRAGIQTPPSPKDRGDGFLPFSKKMGRFV